MLLSLLREHGALCKSSAGCDMCSGMWSRRGTCRAFTCSDPRQRNLRKRCNQTPPPPPCIDPRRTYSRTVMPSYMLHGTRFSREESCTHCARPKVADTRQYCSLLYCGGDHIWQRERPHIFYEMTVVISHRTTKMSGSLSSARSLQKRVVGHRKNKISSWPL